ncbi:MAG TPA: substrate-binding domain-containing protein [Candidatus Pullichristensenella excrementigallinarum]|uniref:Substrate-binding domain-containing protein n=1 Tax=Candidatus Pullichristensenella excrementigallinarum TaxID=2840907 RepID=A0A9D1IBG0_9FIRM|nr:substrate-binding domain-containing protein [Candidatus Pullichristensenella excrementigallinarum]
MKKVLGVLLALGMLLAVACAEAPQMTVEEYPRVDGSTATLPLSYALMAEVTGISQEEAKDYITHNRTTGSFYKLVDGEADILLVGKPAQEALEYAQEKGVELEIKPIGVDALVFLISDQNPVDSLTKEQVVGIYSGEITNWRQVGGEDLPIRAYQRNETAGSQVMMKNVVMGEVEMTDAPVEYRPGDMAGLVEVIASYRNTADAIGYSVYFYVTNMYIQQGIKLLEVDGVAPSNETIASGDYPYTQEYLCVIRKDAAEDSPERRLFNYLTSEEGKQLIAENGYVPCA